jgi:PAS domain S-box-containing protein
MSQSDPNMVDLGRVPDGFRQITVNFRVLVYIIALTALIFAVDVITPLGLTVWILYIIPLILTLYLTWRYAPFFGAGIFIVLIGTSFFLSPRDIPLLFAVADRLFFTFVLLITAAFIWNHKKTEEVFQKNEERFHCLAESSSDAMVVHIGGKVVYVNRSALNLFGADSREDLVGKDLTILVDPSDRDLVRRMADDVLLGTTTPVREVRMVGSGGNGIQVEVFNEKVVWDRAPAVLTIIRDISDMYNSV